MATNRELKAEIETLSERLGVSVETERLNNTDLSKLVEQLREKASAQAGGGTAAPPQDTGAGHTSLLRGATKRVPDTDGSSGASADTPPDTGASTSAGDEGKTEEEEAGGDAGVIAGATPDGLVPPAELSDVGPGRYFVAQGQVVYCLKGKLGAFASIQPSDVGGQEQFDELVRAGAVFRRTKKA